MFNDDELDDELDDYVIRTGMIEDSSPTINIDDIQQNTTNVTDRINLAPIDCSSFDTSNVTSMYKMFSGCSSYREDNSGNQINTSDTIISDESNIEQRFQNDVDIITNHIHRIGGLKQSNKLTHIRVLLNYYVRLGMITKYVIHTDYSVNTIGDGVSILLIKNNLCFSLSIF